LIFSSSAAIGSGCLTYYKTFFVFAELQEDEQARQFYLHNK